MKEFVLVPRHKYDLLIDKENQISSIKSENLLPPEIEENILAHDNLKKRKSLEQVKSKNESKLLYSIGSQTDIGPDVKPNGLKNEHERKQEVKTEDSSSMTEVSSLLPMKTKSIIPIYSNTLPVALREEAMDLLAQLVNEGIIGISSDGTVTTASMRETIHIEELLRLLFVKFARVADHEKILTYIVKFIKPEFIRNAKARDLVNIVGTGKQNKLKRFDEHKLSG